MRRLRVGAPLALLLAVSLTACAPALPDTVVPGTGIALGWTGEFTSANAAASPTPGNVAVAQTIRSGFGDVVDGEFVADASFGEVTIVGEDPFIVRYDLAEPAWSDGIPLDAADLLLGWAAASGSFDPKAEADAGDAVSVSEPPDPAVDEFARAIDVTFAQPVIGWQRAVTVPVPAHVVGRRAFGIDDAMEAKQAVIRAIQTDDRAALEKISAVWNEGFEVAGGDEIDTDLLLSSGPFLVDEVRDEADGQTVALVPNPAFRGAPTPRVARIDLVPRGDAPIADLGTRLDVVTLAPTTADRGPIRELERQDVTVSTSHDGTTWALLLNPVGVFTAHPARVAFIRAASPAAMVERGAGLWSQAYTGSTSMLSSPGSRAYDIVTEDSGFPVALGTPAEDAAREREAAGVSEGAGVCVLYDRAEGFAAGAFAALRDAAAEAGWNVIDCGSDDFEAALTQRGWDAVITRTTIPQTPEQIAEQWGTGGPASLTGHADPQRDELIARYATITDVYEARDVLAQIEATIVQAAVALPLAVNPLVTIVDRGVTGVTTPNGDAARLTGDAAQWEALP
jgi:peptide/nickel transport system substrate-binding protein